MTLGISTNTRLLGLAVIHDGYLRDFSIHRHKLPWSPEKITRIIASLEPCVRRYSIKNVVLSIPHAYHQTPQWKRLIATLETYCTGNGLSVHKRKVEEIYSLCPKDGKKTKKALMLYLTDLYPELTLCYRKELKNKNKYYVKLFEALAVAMLHEAR